ncbi:phage tail sheath protein [Acetobacter sicerae]|uniref:phage tail protein n=1 Tax=Acetobacter sicerae TaxID=85325 RepID=UPI00156B39CF|nr:phage tail protein [Acetobacter sicerae]NHN93639.1 phage tail protein [Acetobacter sicerae]
MALIYQAGQVQQTGQIVPQLFVSIQQPAQVALNGVSTQRIGIIGTASWGPVNTPTALSDIAGYRSAFGEKQPGATDMGVAVSVAQLQGTSDFRCVRVTDGTDTAATGTLSGVTFTAACTGTSGNALTVALSQVGSSTNWQLVTSHAVLGSRAYTGANWEALKTAVSADGSAVIAVMLPATTPVLAAGSVTLSGGTNGGAPTTAQFVGSDDTDARTGMYALRNQGCALGFIHGLTDTTQASVIGAFGMSEGVYMIATGPSGDTIANAIALSASAGYKSYGLKMMFGDWLYFSDDTLGTVMVSPQSFVAGKLATLAPSDSSLNKQITGIVGSQKAGLVSAGSSKTYSNAELAELFTAGIDVVCNPAPGGSYWAVRGGYNTSLNDLTWGDEYTRLTNYIAESLAAGMGAYVGQPINNTLFGDVRASILGLLSDMRGAGYLDNTGTTVPYSAICDTSNNPQSRTAIGYLQADVAVQYMGIVRFFYINMQGGAGVTITVSNS